MQSIKNKILFIDTEVDIHTKRIFEYGATDGKTIELSTGQHSEFMRVLTGFDFICGHNILNFDTKFIEKHNAEVFKSHQLIDTLYLSPLLFPQAPYHALVKDDKLITVNSNNPVSDAKACMGLLYDEIEAFRSLESSIQILFYQLLKDQVEFASFFNFIGFKAGAKTNLSELIRREFKGTICSESPINELIKKRPIELSYCLALINNNNSNSTTPPWVIKNYSQIYNLWYLLKSKRCMSHCEYCNSYLDIHKALKKYFGYENYRKFDGKSLQEQAVEAASNSESFIAVFPTGGGKSLTFQVPALMSGDNVKGLTVVISPLQSLMKDQVDNLVDKGITAAVAINGLLDPIERAEAIERVKDGSISILYISPESLRSRTITRLLLGRNLVRVVIDEAHCFSSWGQDFRVDYLYIGRFLVEVQRQKNLDRPIPISCFTATAKPQVINDIQEYFLKSLGLKLDVYSAGVRRTNLNYKIIPLESSEKKYLELRRLIDAKNCATIIYVSRTGTADKIAKRLENDGYSALAYHGKKDKEIKSKNQDSFISGRTQIMVATSAFGMGVDKSDIKLIIHYEISDSLENYIQESGRAGRDQSISADCFVLFDEQDLNKHFLLLNQTKLHIKEIQQMWSTVKHMTNKRNSVSKSALELARKSGWNDSVYDVETRVKTAISTLEESGYLKRSHNIPQIYATSIIPKNAEDAIKKINASKIFNDKDKVEAIRIVKSLYSSKYRKRSEDQLAESRVDYISDALGIPMAQVIDKVNKLREVKILADDNDMTVFLPNRKTNTGSLKKVKAHYELERFLITNFYSNINLFNIKELNEKAEENNINASPKIIKTILNYLKIKNFLRYEYVDFNKSRIHVDLLYNKDELFRKLELRYDLAIFILKHLYARKPKLNDESDVSEIPLEFSTYSLKEKFSNRNKLIYQNVDIKDIEDALLYLSRIETLKIEGGFLVIYQKLKIERVERNNRIQYKQSDYESLEKYYTNKVQQIHIVGEYAKLLIENYSKALSFVDDYFQLNYSSFLKKHFNSQRIEEISKNITPSMFKALFGKLSPTQLNIINDKDSDYISVLAGPGSGKTRILVHKIASLLLMEDVKHEQMLMLTFSRSAALEFKMRLLDLIGNAALFVEIKTYHSYCFNLLGQIGDINKSKDVIKRTVEKIKANEIEVNAITKSVLVIDEAQDMDESEYQLIKELMHRNEKLRVIIVGDDDQNIYEFRGANSIHLKNFTNSDHTTKYDLLRNYRSRPNLVDFFNHYLKNLNKRLKSIPLFPHLNENGKIYLYHQVENLLGNLIDHLRAVDLSGSSCVLTKTNFEALQVAGALQQKNYPVTVLQTNSGFSLYDLDEIRYFINTLNLSDSSSVISTSNWDECKRKLKVKFSESDNYSIVLEMLSIFERTHPKRIYVSDFKIYIQESKLEDFYNNRNQDMVTVATMHKSKGKEFDNVIILLNDYRMLTEQDKRVLYVAMTRAKTTLTIISNDSLFINYPGNDIVHMKSVVSEYTFNKLILQLSHKDVWLDSFIKHQHNIKNIKSGDLLNMNHEGCSFNSKNVLMFSNHFKDKLSSYIAKGYSRMDAKVNHVLYWKKKDSDNEFKILLPLVILEKVSGRE